MNTFDNIWNHNYILEQAQIDYHKTQVKQVQDTAKALCDFLNGCDKIDPAYQQQAMEEFCMILSLYFNKHNRG